ncbi:unnamed protein product [Parnassius mnemosyne]|uniref:Uncharacterized protein n=1 Tax=Parnassius mnemosyne TaxID=213953 RepID=A0AAV1KYW6_9NEOP
MNNANVPFMGSHKYEYDSDEDTSDGTWEHRLRAKEMNATGRMSLLNKPLANIILVTDLLPPEELKKIMEKYSAIKNGKETDLSDYKEFKLKEDNPVANLGLGASSSDIVSSEDDEFDAYRKRMMLAYGFRPNPLNNPRPPYY